jgi:hypothetical protein
MARTKTRPVGRTPIKRRACEAWLEKQLTGRPWPAQNILEAGAKLGWGWATVRRAKVNVGAQSFKRGNEWWWFDPNTYKPPLAPSRVVAKDLTPRITENVTERTEAVEQFALEQEKLPQATAVVADLREDLESRKSATHSFSHLDNYIENKKKEFVAPAPSPTREPQTPKPVEPPKPRRIRIWESEVKETRDVLISAAGFADLYVMRADIWLRQEHLRARGLLKEALALNDLLSRVNEALEKKKRNENIDVNQSN